MRAILSFNGSRGDVQPGIALAVALRERGHDVVMAVPPNLVDFATRAGVDAHPCGRRTDDVLESDTVSRELKSSNPLRRLNAISELTLRGGRGAQDTLMDLTTDVDVIVGSSVGQERAVNVAEKRAVPYVPVHFCPVRRNGSATVLPIGHDLPPWAIRAGWTVLEQVLWQATRRTENALRVDLGLPPARASTASRIARNGTQEIQAFDGALFPGLAAEWGEMRPLIGFLDLDPLTRAAVDAHPGSDPDLTEWLAQGTPPVYVGFGSMTVPEPQRVAAALTAAADTVGRRVLVASGWSDFMADTPRTNSSVYVTRSVDHARVLPRCIAAVHHGGAGTTAAALRAGLPTFICSFGADQPMWGRALRRIGAGTSVPIKQVTEATATEGLEAVLSEPCRTAARTLADRLVPAETAVRRAVNIVENAA